MAIYLVYAVGCFVAFSLRWPLVGDATLLHYCVFLMRHGFGPYRQLVDVNLPGTYFVEWAVTGLFGYGPLAWRLFDLALVGVLGATVPVLAGGGASASTSKRRLTIVFSTVWATGLFALMHGRDGIAELGQRDLVMTALVALACALLFSARRAAPGVALLLRMALMGFAIGAAATVKPLALLLLPAWLACMAVGAGRSGRSMRAPTAAALAGAALPVLACLWWLLHMHALAAFLDIVRNLVPLHASLFRLSPLHLLSGTVSSVVLPVFLLGVAPVLAARPWRSFEGAVLVVALLFGALSFWLQGRGYPYHRYPSEWFLLVLWVRVLPQVARGSTALPQAARRSTALPQAVRGRAALLKTCAVLALMYGAFVLAPRSLHAVRGFTPAIDTQGAALQAVLTRDGGAQLNGDVQCLDMAGGCITTLLRMRLVQSTGYLYDCYAMAPVARRFRSEQERYREGWMRALQAHPPRLFIAFSDECGPADERYTLLTRWPALQNMLNNSYSLQQQWTPTLTQRWNYGPELPYGFRIYTRAGTAAQR